MTHRWSYSANFKYTNQYIPSLSNQLKYMHIVIRTVNHRIFLKFKYQKPINTYVNINMDIKSHTKNSKTIIISERDIYA